MVDGVKAHQGVALRCKHQFAHRGIANAHVHLDEALKGRTQECAHRGRDGAAAGDHQYIALVLRPHMGHGILNALHKFGERRHASGLRRTVHPSLQTFA